ncbi:MAG: acyl carrier protein [Lachnospiraceae bacterium]|jgi:acyl carrier protein|nr:acyl carrier protein [Lachnospiraceae bacterium]MBQ6637992.1 acyl carrier protein [Lachnospiraceae bacterium]MBR3636852.1 acyl carrier protein [Lachnospiraceae bacterium]
MYEKIKAIMMEQLNIEEDDITEDTSFKDDLGLDSLDLFELAMAIEEEFGVEIPQEDLEGIVTVGDAVEYIRENGIE